MESKLSIDLNTGIIKVRGSEEFIKYIFENTKDFLKFDSKNTANIKSEDKSEGNIKENEENRNRKAKKKKNINKQKPEIINDLNLSNNSSEDGLKEFLEKYNPKTAMEYNVLFVYYLQNIKKIEKIGPDHIYTCYQYEKIKTPTNLYQSIADTKARKKALLYEERNDIKLSMLGNKMVEEELIKSDEG